MKANRFRIVGWTVSSLCLAGAAGLIANRHAAFVEASRRDVSSALDLQKAREAALAVVHQPHETRFACAIQKSSEETEFITDLRRRAHACGISIARWNSHSEPYKKAEKTGPPAEGDATSKLLDGVTKVSCDVALDGSYPALRTFLRGLWEADRLFTVSHVDWSRAEKGSQLSMTLGRYVVPAPPKPVAASASSGVSEGPSNP